MQIKEQNGYLSVTLSSEFLQDSEELDLGAEERRLAILSIVNSITELGEHSRVLVLVDKQDNGTGTRLTGNEAGFTQLGVSTLEPLSRDVSVLLTVQKTVELSLMAVVERDYGTLMGYLAQADFDGSTLPDAQTVSDSLSSCKTLVSFSLQEGITLSADGQQATVTLDYTCVDSSGLPVETGSVPLRLVRESIWKLSYASLLAGLSQP